MFAFLQQKELICQAYQVLAQKTSTKQTM